MDDTAVRRDGTSQDDRRTPALEEGFVWVDERRPEELLAMAVEHARLLTFYNAHNEPDGDWEVFVTSDEAIVMAMILTTAPEHLATAVTPFATALQRPAGLERAGGVATLPTYVLAQHIDWWYTTLQTNDSEAGRSLWQKLDEVIYEKLGPELVALGRFVGQYEAQAEERLQHTFHSAWFRHGGEVPQVPARLADEEARELFLTANFQAFDNAITFLKTWAVHFLPVSLGSQTHGAASGLYIAFVQLFRTAQERLNRFTQRHLRFYYEDVLRVQRRPSAPDHTYLLFQPDAGQTVPVQAGTAFLAGVDAQQRDIIYTADQDLLVHDAQVRALYTLHLVRDPLTAPENALRWYAGAQVHQIPIPEATLPTQEQTLPAWPAFGAVKSHEEQHVFPDAELGFALASTVLALAEGERTITLTFHFRHVHATAERTLDTLLERLTDSMQAEQPEYADLAGQWRREDLTTEQRRLLQAYKLDTFVKLFRHMFRISLTTPQGWYDVGEYLPIAPLVETTYRTDRLALQIHLEPEAPPIVAYQAALHGGQYPTDLPLARFMVNPQAYVYPYALLQGVLLHEIQIDVEVQGIRHLLVYNDLGQLNPTSPFQPFGPLPSVGASVIVGNAEAAQKHLTSLTVEVEWGDWPAGRAGLQEHYQAYDMPFDEGLFAARVTVLRDGRWLPADETQQPTVALFRSAETAASHTTLPTTQRWVLAPSVIRLCTPLPRSAAMEDFGYTALTRGGFVQFTLSTPPYAFGHKDYARLLTHTLTVNARLKHPRLFKPLPQPPYTPLINRMALHYTAVAHLLPEQMTALPGVPRSAQFFHIHPFGVEELGATSGRQCRLVPCYESRGNLFIGLAAQRLTGILSLFFHVREDSAEETETDGRAFMWFYLASNQWRPLGQARVLADTTHGLVASGIVTLQLPEDINTANTVMPSQFYWLRVSVRHRPEAPCSLYGVYAQAMRVTRQLPEPAPPEAVHPIPAGTIKAARVSIPGLRRITQVVASAGGRSPESAQHVNTRLSERLRHKQRATVPWDYERLILEHFPQIFKVKCFANTIDHRQHWHRPGHILLVVLTYPQAHPQMHLRPLANGRLLREIGAFVRPLASPFARITVRNPVYEQIQVHCTVKFRAGLGDGYIPRLNHAITAYLSPWHPGGYRAQFGWHLRRYDLEAYMRQLDYVDFVTEFSMLHIVQEDVRSFRLLDTVQERQDDVSPVVPWGIAVPVRRHLITTTERMTPIPAQTTGINALEVGSTFIIS